MALQQKLNDFNNFLKLEEEAFNALLEFRSIDITKEIQFLEWLVKYEDLHYNLILLHPDTVSEESIKTGVIKLCEDLNFHFKTALLQNCIDVEAIFDSFYYDKLNKYNTIPEEQLDNQSPFDNVYQYTSSLKYHLEKRGII